MKIAAAAGWFQVLQIYSRVGGKRERKTSLFPNGPRNPGAFGPFSWSRILHGHTRNSHNLWPMIIVVVLAIRNDDFLQTKDFCTRRSRRRRCTQIPAVLPTRCFGWIKYVRFTSLSGGKLFCFTFLERRELGGKSCITTVLIMERKRHATAR